MRRISRVVKASPIDLTNTAYDLQYQVDQLLSALKYSHGDRIDITYEISQLERTLDELKNKAANQPAEYMD